MNNLKNFLNGCLDGLFIGLLSIEVAVLFFILILLFVNLVKLFTIPWYISYGFFVLIVYTLCYGLVNMIKKWQNG